MTEPLGPVALLVGLLALLAGAGGRVLDRPPWEPLRTWLDRAFRSGHDGTPGVDAGTRPARGDGTSGVRPPGADAPDSLLETARDRFSSGEYEGTAQAAYMHARLRLADAYDVGLGWTHRGFFEDCREGGLGEDLDVLDELTTVYERAVFSTEPVGEADARRALELSAKLTERPGKRHPVEGAPTAQFPSATGDGEDERPVTRTER